MLPGPKARKGLGRGGWILSSTHLHRCLGSVQVPAHPYLCSCIMVEVFGRNTELSPCCVKELSVYTLQLEVPVDFFRNTKALLLLYCYYCIPLMVQSCGRGGLG